MVKDREDFYCLSRELLLTEPLRRHFVYAPSQTNGKLFFHVFVLIKRCLYNCTHLYFCNDKTVPTVL